MRVTILPYAIILTKAHSATVGMMAKGCIVAFLNTQQTAILHAAHFRRVVNLNKCT